MSYKDNRLLSPMAVDLMDKLLKGQSISDSLTGLDLALLTGD